MHALYATEAMLSGTSCSQNGFKLVRALQKYHNQTLALLRLDISILWKLRNSISSSITITLLQPTLKILPNQGHSDTGAYQIHFQQL